jgi:DnaJ-class molecular chaperone
MIECPWCRGTGKPTEPGDPGDWTGTYCSRCEGAGEIEKDTE